MGISEMLQNYWSSPLVTDRIAFVGFVIAPQEQDILEKMVIISLVIIDLGLYQCEMFECLLCIHRASKFSTLTLMVSIVSLKYSPRVCLLSLYHFLLSNLYLSYISFQIIYFSFFN